MNPGIIIAILLSLGLVGGATYTRFSSSSSEEKLVSLEQTSKNDEFYKGILTNFDADNTEAPSTGSLSGTDLISRQMILDYVEMARNGGATEKNLEALANKYIDSVPTLISSKKLAYTDLKIVTNTQINFNIYAREIENAYIAYTKKVSDSERRAGETDDEINDVSQSMGVAYEDMVSVLQNMSVPAELAPAHLDLTNTYLKSAAAMKSISELGSDPASSFAGLIVIKENVAKEEESISQIRTILSKHGL